MGFLGRYNPKPWTLKPKPEPVSGWKLLTCAPSVVEPRIRFLQAMNSFDTWFTDAIRISLFRVEGLCRLPTFKVSLIERPISIGNRGDIKPFPSQYTYTYDTHTLRPPQNGPNTHQNFTGPSTLLSPQTPDPAKGREPGKSPLNPTWRFMGTYNARYKSTYHLLRGLRGLISTVMIGVTSTLNLQASPRLWACGCEVTGIEFLFWGFLATVRMRTMLPVSDVPAWLLKGYRV